jgi:hypothetical protein
MLHTIYQERVYFEDEYGNHICIEVDERLNGKPQA